MYLSGTRGLEYLSQLKNLRVLRIVSPQFTDASLIHIAKLTRLEELELNGHQFTGSGLVHFRNQMKSFAPIYDVWLEARR